SEICKPPITTINVDSELMAEKAVEALLQRIAEPDRPAMTITISGDLIVKGSVRAVI
ncbi:MAG: substrate-binding domain-containing protein, partial [Oscillospiraceae bacterium]|nr:substrate-binding domain-containing protein [Oscillospiraceae bacterium]